MGVSMPLQPGHRDAHGVSVSIGVFFSKPVISVGLDRRHRIGPEPKAFLFVDSGSQNPISLGERNGP